VNKDRINRFGRKLSDMALIMRDLVTISKEAEDEVIRLKGIIKKLNEKEANDDKSS